MKTKRKVSLEYVLNNLVDVTEEGDVFYKGSGVFLKKYNSAYGYHIVHIKVEPGNQQYFFVHRLVAFKYLPKGVGQEHVNHKDSVRTNNHVSNLEWCTPLENVRHCWANGRHKKTTRGQKYISYKSTDIMVEIGGVREKLSYWEKIYHVKPQTVWFRMKRLGWGDVESVTKPTRKYSEKK